MHLENELMFMLIYMQKYCDSDSEYIGAFHS